MKLAIISDTHFGDDNCLLVTKQNSDVALGAKYKEFADAVGKDNDYLVLAGDVFDFSITSYENAYKCGKTFLQQIRNDGIAKEIIYLAGNHDADIWHMVQNQKSVINRLNNNKLPESYQHSVAGIIEDRTALPQDKRGLILNQIAEKADADGSKYGGMFLDNITNPPTTFNFAYPNLYIVTDRETVLVTHGHYFDLYWAILGETAMKLAKDELKVGEPDVEKMVQMNFPLSQLACTGIGQAGVLTHVIRQVQSEVVNGDLKKVGKYLDRLEAEIGSFAKFGGAKEMMVNLIIGQTKKRFLEAIGGVEQARYSEAFIYKKEVKDRFRRFYRASLLEIEGINARTGLNIPSPWRIIFGHTHQPISWENPHPPELDSESASMPKRLVLSNTGGWIAEKGTFCGAEIFIYETGRGFGSVPVRPV